ncbi:TPA: DNA polymerase II large subunit [Candidatus Micrarchaeota archaeon]|nr:MAG: DNA polymerase II large subunit [Candidatus Micrarchaeota archaeon CG1_02_51_15]HII39324.1 DNA polymerase II large subunit [Candidatus Micrarchaeota archaeon]
MPICSPHVQAYFDSLSAEFNKAYAIAGVARAKGLDPVNEVEIAPAADVAARVEGLVGPPGIAKRIRELISSGIKRNAACYEVCKEIIDGKHPFSITDGRNAKEAAIEQAVRTALALFTEGVVSAPIEGISKVKLRKNADGSECIAVYFAGPIRGAGGTGQAFTLVLADFCRKHAGIGAYRATEDEIERYVEESNLYAIKTRAGQYVPKDEEVRHIARSCPVCVDGEPTEDYDVSVHKNVFGVETNRVRGGMCLVLSEGICLKAAKVLKITKAAELDWIWIEKLIKVSKQEQSKVEIKQVTKYIDEIVAGRAIFGYPMRPGGFRLRYGRTPYTGIASKAIHPATMAVLRDFPAIGTQVKVERPGKGCIVTPCNSIDGPIVRLKDGSVKQIQTLEEARAITEQVEHVVFLGDILVNYGDFSKANHPLVPGAWCDEWYSQELLEKGVKKTKHEITEMKWDESLQLARSHDVPLAPKFTLFWHDLTPQQLSEAAQWICSDGKPAYEWFDIKELRIKNGKQKELLEWLGVIHRLETKDGEETIVVEKEHALALLFPLGLLEGKTLSTKKFDAAFAIEKDAMQIVNELAGVTIKKKAGLYIGTCMGRPEKSKERKMQPPVHALFPIGLHGGKRRDMMKAVKTLRARAESSISADVAIRACRSCGKKTASMKCACGSHTALVRECTKCGRLSPAEKCVCGSPTRTHSEQQLEIVREYEEAMKNTGCDPREVKAVQGLISADKVFEPLSKGMLRAKHDVFVFRDGTCRYDATEVPLTHFVPREISVTIERLRQLGYEKDYLGKPLERDDQTVELLPQDVVISDHNADYFLRLTAFVDDLLVYHYAMPPYYNAKTRADLVGQLVIAIAPHISAGIIGRIIGFTPIRGLLMHPYMHCATRRNCDGDEDCLMLLMDAVLNFSKTYLPSTRGGRMDAPLVLTTILDPVEVDDEVHAMDACSSYPLEFYRATERFASPSEIKLDTISTRLGKESQYEGIGFTHTAKLEGPTQTRYVLFKNMRQKVEDELQLMNMLRSVDAANAAERIILSHFFPDLYGNMHSFGKQGFRCVDCGAKYRRVPLRGKCTNKTCGGGKIILTIYKGGIEKYLSLAKDMIDTYGLPLYMKQRIMLLEKEIQSMFEDDKVKQHSLADYF